MKPEQYIQKLPELATMFNCKGARGQPDKEKLRQHLGNVLAALGSDRVTKIVVLNEQDEASDESFETWDEAIESRSIDQCVIEKRHYRHTRTVMRAIVQRKR